jgi:hypothetical protein
MGFFGAKYVDISSSAAIFLFFLLACSSSVVSLRLCRNFISENAKSGTAGQSASKVLVC